MRALYGLLCENKSLVLWGECCEPSSGLCPVGVGGGSEAEQRMQAAGHTCPALPHRGEPSSG